MSRAGPLMGVRYRKRCSGRDGGGLPAPAVRGAPQVAQKPHSGSSMALQSAQGTGTSTLPQKGQKRACRSTGL